MSHDRARIDDELEFHFAETVDALIAEGMSAAEARQEAHRRFGDRRRYRRQLTRVDRSFPGGPGMQLDSLLLDIRHALRALRASRTFTIAALVVLMFGIGATTAIFSVVDVVVLRGLPFPDSSRLMAVGERRAGMRAGNDVNGLLPMAPQNFLDVVRMQRVFASVGAMTPGSMTLFAAGADPEDLNSARTTATFFETLGVQPVAGRTFTAANESAGGQFVTVLSNALWRRRFGADPGVIGRTIRLDGGSYEVIGVMPPRFTYPAGAPRPVDLWVPYVVPATEQTRPGGAARIYLQTIARLAPGVTPAAAAAQMSELSAQLQAAYPDTNKTVTIGTRSLRDNLVGADVASWMLMLLATAGIVLVIACANVASLFMARASARSKEIGIRVALGSSRARIVRHLVVESLLLSTAGTVLAVVLAAGLVGALRNALPALVPRTADIAVDLRVLLVIATVSVLSGVLFGCLPAITASRPDLREVIHAVRGQAGGRQPMRQALVVVEVALAVVLLVGAGLFIGSFVEVTRVDLGIKTSNLLLVQLAPRAEPGKPRPDLRAGYADVAARTAATPGVVAAGVVAGGTPLGNANARAAFAVGGQPTAQPVSFRRVTPDYFRAMGISLRRGRAFDDGDREGRPAVAIINDTAGRMYFGGTEPVGQTVKVDGTEYTVVGIVGDALQNWIEGRVAPEVSVPLAYGAPGAVDLVVRTSGNPLDALAAVKAAMRVSLPDLPVRDVRTMDAVLSKQLSERRLDMLLLTLFGLVGMVISAVGVYGVMAHLVAARTREIGLRMALGARRSAAIGMVIRSAVVLVAAGLALGAVAAWMLTATARTFLFKVDAADPRIFGAALVVLAAAGLTAAAIPARRAANVDPMVALRSGD